MRVDDFRPPRGAPQHANHRARLHVQAAQHVARPPEVVGHRFAARYLPRRPQQSRPLVVDQHKHPHRADLIADHLGDVRVRRQTSLEQIAALGKLLDLVGELTDRYTLAVFGDEAIGRQRRTARYWRRPSCTSCPWAW